MRITNVKISKEEKMDKIKGALYGFAIGDAMGATTEFMNTKAIKKQYGKVTDIIGGGWLSLEPGEVTDDTQMMMCVGDALMRSDGEKSRHTFSVQCANNFSSWLNSGPKDVGSQCSRGITYFQVTGNFIQDDKSALGNGSLMRALPCALLGELSYNLIQSDITHPNNDCRRIIKLYHDNIVNLINGEKITLTSFGLMNPSGHIENTFNNALFWASSHNFSDCIIGAVNDGGDADTIAAIAGSLAGARFGFKKIPKNWVEKLDKNVKKSLENFAEYVYKFI